MNNRTQQRFDASIREALAETERAKAHKPRRDATPPKPTKRPRAPKGRLYLDPETGATVWCPAAGGR